MPYATPYEGTTGTRSFTRVISTRNVDLEVPQVHTLKYIGNGTGDVATTVRSAARVVTSSAVMQATSRLHVPNDRITGRTADAIGTLQTAASKTLSSPGAVFARFTPGLDRLLGR